ncbi:coactosin-like protein [Centruroides sculpturatus]|uniref:coactosin-like protein n=1 Tax=Centruroides sculpturatus TaxID=218467 RepID=UPI000C6DEFD1|nr:coactosin-like protein [Centruroides sculpturatus]
MATAVDKDALYAAYEDVRSDLTKTNWAIFKYDGTMISYDSSGDDLSEINSKFSDDERAFAFVRVIAGDEMSKRTKFVFLTWIGPKVSPLKRARVSTDKALVKQIIQNFAVELQLENADDLTEDYLRKEVKKAGGANYGTGI